MELDREIFVMNKTMRNLGIFFVTSFWLICHKKDACIIPCSPVYLKSFPSNFSFYFPNIPIITDTETEPHCQSVYSYLRIVSERAICHPITLSPCHLVMLHPLIFMSTSSLKCSLQHRCPTWWHIITYCNITWHTIKSHPVERRTQKSLRAGDDFSLSGVKSQSYIITTPKCGEKPTEIADN